MTSLFRRGREAAAHVITNQIFTTNIPLPKGLYSLQQFRPSVRVKM